MTLNFIKKTICTIVTITCTLFLSLSLLSPKAAGEISFLTACVGETYDTVGINYHCTENNSYLIYGTSTNGNEIVNPTRVDVTSTLWSYQSDYNGTGTPDYEKGYVFEERYVCKGQLTNLKANTTYYYQAVSGSSKSDIQYFTTTNNNASKKSFLFLTDIQSSGGSFKNAETLIQAIETESGYTPNLVVMTGDQVDRGGVQQQWIDYYKYIPSLHNKLQATVPGNHEYYLTSGSGYISNEIYNQFTNNPANGPDDRIGSSYYFIWDQILFIMLDTVKTNYNVEAQQEWFRNVVKNNPSQWIIVGSHPGMYATGAYASDASIMRRNWLKVFEECQVDLALNGHEHVYCRKTKRYEGSSTSPTAGKFDEELGITYLQGAAAGLKSYSDQMQQDLISDFDVILKGNNNMGVLVNVETGRLIVKCYMASGMIVDQFELKAKRPTQVANITNDEVMESINASFNAETESVNVEWSRDLYGNAKSVDVSAYIMGINNTKLFNENIIIASSAVKANSRTYKGYYDSNNYLFKFKVNMNDGTIIEKEIPLILNPNVIEYKLDYVLNGGTNNKKNPNKYTPQILPLTLEDATKLGYDFKGWTNKDTGRRVREIKIDTTGDITLVANFEPTVYRINCDLNGGNLSELLPATYTIENIPELPIPTKNGYKFTGWSLNGEIIENINENNLGDLILTATFEKIYYKISYELDGGVNKNDAPTLYSPLDIPTLPTPTKDGYKFIGWMLNNELITSIPDNAGDIELFAKFEEKEYKITYYLEGGTNPNNAPTTYTLSNIPNLPTPTKDGYDFTGWMLNGEKISQLPNNLNKDLILTATWNKVQEPNNNNNKGCKNCSSSIIISTIALLAAAIVLLKKKD